VKAIEAAYRNLDIKVRDIAAEHCVSVFTIYDLATKRGWPKREKVKAATGGATLLVA